MNDPNVRHTTYAANQDQVQLARRAANGDAVARTSVTELAHPIIQFQTNRFCKRFCRENQHRYMCTLDPPMGNPPYDAPLCEWGNASYGWMLEDLTNANRLCQFEGKQGARIYDYLYCIANSLPFYERWKDWRFGRKIHVPTYIQDLCPDAGKAFLALRSGELVAAIAQKLAKSEQYTQALCERIVLTLTQRNRLHLLDPPSTVSLSQHQNQHAQQEDTPPVQWDIPSYDEAPEQTEINNQLHQAWQKLSTVEQFVLEAMLIEEQDAQDVLNALVKLDLSFDDDIHAQQLNRQQLYYFRRKTIAKLARLMDEETR